MQARTLLLLCLVALLAFAVSGESAVKKLKAKVEAGQAPAPCDKANAAVAGPAPPRQFLDQRLPVVVDDYHAPTGGFAVSHIPDKEVDVAARRILREIQAHEAEMKEMGADPNAAAQQSTDGILTPEEHTALKQLLTDADILVRHAAKALAENGPIDAAAARRVAASAVLKAASAEKAAASALPVPPLPAEAAAAVPNVASTPAPAAAAAAAAAPAPAAATPAPAEQPASKPVEPSAPLPAAVAAPAAPAAATPAAAEPIQVKAAAPVAVSSKAAHVRK